MDNALKESVSHGTKGFPFAYYIMENIRPGFNVPLHWHDEIEILYIESGTLHLSINQVSLTGHPRDVFLANPRQIHGMWANDSSLRYHAIVFPLHFCTFQARNVSGNDLFLPLSEGHLLLASHLPTGTAQKETSQCFKQIIALQKDRPAGYQLGIQILCAQILYNLYAMGCYKKLSPSNREEDMKREILLYLQDNYTEKISLKELADTFHMSEKYFSRYFIKQFQMSLTDYLNSLRLKKAAELLADTDLSVTDAALQSGFHNVSYFIRTFKEAFGCTPLAYRASS